MFKKVVIGAPIRNQHLQNTGGKNLIIPYYLRGISNLFYPKRYLSVVFLYNGKPGEDDTLQQLQTFKKRYADEYSDIIIKSTYYHNPPYLRVPEFTDYTYIATVRNSHLSLCMSTDSDYLFSVDSDVILKACTLTNLLRRNEDMVSALICNAIKPPKIWNIMKKVPVHTPVKDESGSIIGITIKEGFVHITDFPVRGLLPVDITGACTLIRKSLLWDNVNKKLNNLYMHHQQGEDIPFCKKLKEKGINIYCDVEEKLHHIMDMKKLESFKSIAEAYYDE